MAPECFVEVKVVITERVGPKALFIPFHYAEAAEYSAAKLDPARRRKEEFPCLAQGLI